MKKTKLDGYNCLIFSLLLISSSVFFKFSLFYSFLISVIYTLFILKIKKYDIKKIIKMSISDVLNYKELYLTITLIGAIVSIWISSGTIANMIYYGFNFINGINFVLFTFIIVSICSFFIGSAVGTFSTVGLVLFSIGSVINIPRELLIGAIVSGSFIADKISPLSGLVNINLNLTETKYNNSFITSLYTLIPTFFITVIIYYFLGKNYIDTNPDNFLYFKETLSQYFNINPIITLFPVVVILLSILNFKSVYTIIMSVFIGSVITYFFQEQSIPDIIRFILWGYESNLSGPLQSVMSGGGIINILEVVFIVISAVFFVSMLIHSDLLNLIIDDFVGSTNSKRSLIFKTSILSLLITVFTCDQTMSLIIPSKLFKKKYDYFFIKRESLFTILSDNGIVIAPIIPWNINYLILTGIVGRINFIPFASLCYLFPIINILVFTVFNPKFLMKNQEPY